jgi:hypothetical protein
LIDAFGVGFADPPCHVMTLIDEDAAFLLHTICVRSARSTAHQEDAVAASQAEVHAALKADALFSTHL